MGERAMIDRWNIMTRRFVAHPGCGAQALTCAPLPFLFPFLPCGVLSTALGDSSTWASPHPLLPAPPHAGASHRHKGPLRKLTCRTQTTQ